MTAICVRRLLFAPLTLLLGSPLAWSQEPESDSALDRTADVVYVATPNDVVAKMLRLAEITEDDVLYDLGCGDGRIAATAARKFGCRSLGFDLDSMRVGESRRTAERYRVEDLVTIEQRDIFELDLAAASVVTLYLLPELNVQLIPQLEKLTGSRIISHDFDMEGVTPDKVVRMTSREDGVAHHLYLWTTPLNKTD